MSEFRAQDVELRTGVDDRRYGGQHVTKTDTSVLAIHTPTGIAFISRTERSQHGNRERAMKYLQLLVDEQCDWADYVDEAGPG